LGIITLARKRDLIPWNQLLAGKILLSKDLGDDFSLTPISSRLTLRDESNAQDGSDVVVSFVLGHLSCAVMHHWHHMAR